MNRHLALQSSWQRTSRSDFSISLSPQEHQIDAVFGAFSFPQTFPHQHFCIDYRIYANFTQHKKSKPTLYVQNTMEEDG